jgi:hypothetical protein
MTGGFSKILTIHENQNVLQASSCAFRLFAWLCANDEYRFSSCIKNTVCKGDVFVVWNSTNKPVVGATVHSHYAQKSDVQTTDASGRVHLELNLPAILTIDITGPANPSPGGTTTSGTLKFESGKTNSVTLGL